MRLTDMKIVTSRPLIRRAAASWKRQYYSLGWNNIRAGAALDSEDTYKALMALDVDKATAEDVATIIGNKSWSYYFCSECAEYTEKAIEVGGPDDSCYICKNCISQCHAMFGAQIDE